MIRRNIVNKNEIIKYIKYLRLSNGYTQQQLADILGLGRMTIVRIEQEGNPTLDTLLKILSHFNEQLNITPNDNSHNSLIRIIGNEIKESIINNMTTSTRCIKYGWIYIFNVKDNLNTIKIGLTREDEPSNRLKSINSHYQPGIEFESKIELYYARLTSDCNLVESKIHSLFDNYRIRNEWFNINATIAKNKLDNIINEMDTPHLSYEV